MRLDFSRSFSWSASILGGLLAVMLGCSSPPDKTTGSSASGPDTTSGTSPVQNPVEPATPSSDSSDPGDMPIPTPPVARRQSVILEPVVPDMPADDSGKAEPPKNPSDSSPAKEAPAAPPATKDRLRADLRQRPSRWTRAMR